LDSQTLFSGFPAGDVARRIYLSLILMLIALVAAGCGAPAEPALRHVPVPENVPDLSVHQAGNDVILTFTVPKDTVWHEPLQHPPAVEIYRGFSGSANPANATKPAAPTRLLTTIPGAMSATYLQDGKIRFVDNIPPETLAQHAGEQDVYLVRTRASRKKSSGDSNLASIPVYPPAEAVHDLAVTQTKQAVVLQWTPVQKSTAGGALPGASVYRVYRSSNAAKSFPLAGNKTAGTQAGAGTGGVDESHGLTVIGDTPAPPFRDTEFEFGREYVYSVRSLVIYPETRLESADSNLLHVTPKDTFPPAAPQGVQVTNVPGDTEAPAHIELSWAINGEADLSGYNVYRSEDGSAPVRVNPETLLSPAFRDMSAVTGHAYRYTVSAVDQAGNESAPSSAVSANVPQIGNEEK
jgi:hypothetical protein